MWDIKKVFFECFKLLLLQVAITLLVLLIIFDHTEIDAIKESFVTTIVTAVAGLIYIIKFLAK